MNWARERVWAFFFLGLAAAAAAAAREGKSAAASLSLCWTSSASCSSESKAQAPGLDHADTVAAIFVGCSSLALALSLSCVGWLHKTALVGSQKHAREMPLNICGKRCGFAVVVTRFH